MLTQVVIGSPRGQSASQGCSLCFYHSAGLPPASQEMFVELG